MSLPPQQYVVQIDSNSNISEISQALFTPESEGKIIDSGLYLYSWFLSFFPAHISVVNSASHRAWLLLKILPPYSISDIVSKVQGMQAFTMTIRSENWDNIKYASYPLSILIVISANSFYLSVFISIYQQQKTGGVPASTIVSTSSRLSIIQLFLCFRAAGMIFLSSQFLLLFVTLLYFQRNSHPQSFLPLMQQGIPIVFSCWLFCFMQSLYNYLLTQHGSISTAASFTSGCLMIVHLSFFNQFF